MVSKDAPFDYRDELGDDAAIECCLQCAIDRKAWHECNYWIDILTERVRRSKGLPPRR